MLDWPIVADPALVETLVSRTRARGGRVQLIRGESGIGKTTLAAAVALRLEELGYSVLPVVGLAELSAIPLAAMTPLLARSGQSGDVTASERLQALFAHVAAGGSRQVLMVDDGPLLDEVSASSIYQLVRVYGVRCLMTARTEHPITGPIARLRDEGAIEVMELDGLGADTAYELVERALGAPVEKTSLRALVERAHGNPLFLRELVLAAERSGVVSSDDASLVIDSRALPTHLRDIIAARFGKLSADERTLAELIAVAQPLPAEFVAVQHSAYALESAGLIERAADGEVYLAHPLFAETLIELMTPAERSERRIAAARRLSDGGGEDLRFKSICLLAETAEPPPVSDLAWAASHAHSLDDHALAVRLSEQALEQEHSFEALSARAAALSSSHRIEEADEAYQRAYAAASTADERAMVASFEGYHIAIRKQRPAEAVRMGVAVLESMPDSATRNFLAADVGKWRLMAGEPQPEPGPEDQASDSADATGVLNTAIYHLVAALFAADLSGARRAIVLGRSVADEAKALIRHGTELMDFGDFFILAFDGHLDEAVRYAEGRRGRHSEEGVGLWNYGLGLLALHFGRVDDALALATLAATQLAWRDFTGALGAAIALRATAAVQLERAELASEVLASIDADARGYMTTALQIAEAEAWVLAGAGDTAGAAAVIERAVARGIEARYFGLACLTAYVAVRLGRAEVVLPQLRAIAEVAEGELVASMVGHAEAFVAGDATVLLAAATRLAGAGCLSGAVDAARQAAALAGAAGMPELVRRANLQAGGWSHGLSGARKVREEGSAELTEREWAVAQAAAGRERSKEIATRLGVSARTVDNHLRNIYRKLGVTSRDELRAELAAVEPRPARSPSAG